MKQLNLDNAKKARDIGMAQVARDSDDWRLKATQVIRELAATNATVTADDLWLNLETPADLDPRVSGWPFVDAAKAGILERTNETRPSGRRSRHTGTVRVWKSRDA